jgi:hypothetical protein
VWERAYSQCAAEGAMLPRTSQATGPPGISNSEVSMTEGEDR